MQNDILPPWQSKIKTTSSMASKSKAALETTKTTLGQLKPQLTPAEIVRLRPHHWYSLSKREKIEAVSALFVCLLAGSLASFFLFIHQPPAPALANIPPKVKPTPPPAPTTLPSPLSGVEVAPDLAKRPVTGIMVENSLDARPQSGLADAGVVYEAIAEGGITRFLALFEDSQPQYVGPVRSLRPYYIDWAVPFDASIAHVGGSPDALAQIRSGMKDLDQFLNPGSYWRVTSRYAPHNVYTSFQRLDGLNQAKGYTSSKVQSWPRKADQPLASPTVKSIDVNLASYYYNDHYDYDPGSNSYLRSEAGKPHIVTNAEADRAGQQLHPKVVIILITPYSVIDRSGHSAYGTNGSGPMFLFQDGNVVQGSWSKADRNSQFIFKDGAGQPVKLNAGQTWLTAAANPAMVVFRP